VSWTAAEYVLPDEPFTGAERLALDGFLDRYRGSFLNRCSGLTAGQLPERPVPRSNLSLIGIARHLTDVELTYFRRRWGGQEIASYYASEDRPDTDFEDASPATAERDLQRLVAEQAAGGGGHGAGGDLREPALGRDVAALGSDPHDRRVRGAHRAGRPDQGADRREGRLVVTARS
jgi:hypothetical protein